MRSLPWLLCAFLLAASAPAGAQTEGAPALAANDQPGDPFQTPDPLVERRKALFDVGFSALVDGNLPLAEKAFAEAQGLPGDPVQSLVAASFVERVQKLRARRRAELEFQRAAEARSAARDHGRSERIALYGITTTLGLALYGWTLPYALGLTPDESPRGFVGLYMLTAAGSFIAPYLLLHDHPVTPGEANLAFYGSTRGIWAGVLLSALVAGEVGPERRDRAWKTSMLVGSIAGLVGGYQWAGASELTPGEARTIAAVGDLGLVMGFGAGFLLHLDSPPICNDFNGFCQTDPEADTHARQMAAMGLAGWGLGLSGGYLLARHRENTWGDGEVLRAATALGIWTAAGVADLGGLDLDLDDRKVTGLMLAGGALGLWAGDRLVRHTDFTVGQSVLIDLATLSGALLGAGTAYLVSKEGEGPYVLSSALGAGAGFALTYWAYRDSADSRTTARLSHLGTRPMLVPTLGKDGERGLALGGRF